MVLTHASRVQWSCANRIISLLNILNLMAHFATEDLPVCKLQIHILGEASKNKAKQYLKNSTFSSGISDVPQWHAQHGSFFFVCLHLFRVSLGVSNNNISEISTIFLTGEYLYSQSLSFSFRSYCDLNDRIVDIPFVRTHVRYEKLEKRRAFSTPFDRMIEETMLII